MLVILLGWIFITLLCWGWGTLLLGRLKIILRDEAFVAPGFLVTCMAGIVCVTIFAGVLSLVMPLGNWLAHIIVVAPCLLIFFDKSSRRVFTGLSKQFKEIRPAAWFLLLSSLALVLIMCSWRVTHPDTLGYHAQTIQWIEQYKAVPGLVHLHVRYGYQGLWFVAAALFDFKFTGIGTITLVNSMVVVWFLFFIIYRINRCIVNCNPVHTILWLLLLAISCLSYTQVRLTVTSASPDFIATLFTWLIFYLIMAKDSNQSVASWLLLVILSVFCITVKLSAAPVFILTIFSAVQLWRLKKIKALLVSLLFIVLILFPFFARNIVTTGYLVFPSPFPDLVNVDWKLDKKETQFEKDYITAYAKNQVDYDEKKVKEVQAMPVTEWIRPWWANQRDIDKIILLICGLSILTAIIRWKVIFTSDTSTRVVFLTTLAGIVFWFVQAPDPRFGFGFIIGLISLVSVLLLARSKPAGFAPGRASLVFITLAGLTIAAYTIYRGMHFFSTSQLVSPLGIENNSYSTFTCDGLKFTVPSDKGPCGDSPIPCLYSDSCNHFRLRGTSISDGFRQNR